MQINYLYLHMSVRSYPVYYTREGLNPVLQLRAAIHSNDWKHKWKDAVLNAA